MTSYEPNENILARWISVLRRRWITGAAVFGVVFLTAIAVVFTARPVYRADAKLRIGEPPPSPGVSAGGASVFGFMRIGGDPFSNDLELLGSRTVAEAIVRDAVLTANVTAPRGWHRDSLFASLSTRDSTITASFEARWISANQIEVEQRSPKKTLVGRFQAGAPASFGGLDVVFRARKPNGPERIRISTLPFGEAVRRTSSRVATRRTRREANVVQIVIQDPDPAIARGVTRAAVARFIELRTRIQKRESGQNIDSLRAVARQTLAELTRAEAELESMQQRTRMVDPDIQSEAFVTRYTELGATLEETRSNLRAIESVLARADSVSTPGERWSKLLSYPAFRENEAIGQMLVQINALEQQRRQLAARRTEQNIEYSLVLDQIAYMDRSLAALAADVRTTLVDEIREQETLAARMDAALAAIPRQTIDLARRQRSARVLSEVLVLTEQRLRQEELRQALSFANVQVIDAPALRYKPVWPRKKLGLAFGWMVASFCALLALVVSERADRRLRRAADVARITDAPVLGVAVRSTAGLHFTAEELGAVVQHASANGRGPLRIVVAPVDKNHGADVVHALREAMPGSTSRKFANPQESEGDGAEILQVSSLVDFASASAAARLQIPIALVVEAGRTTSDDLARATGWVRQAGGRIGGTIVLCDSERRAGEVWA
jgi:uncharacterized protein involved in exopolysaccharide biosynthesis